MHHSRTSQRRGGQCENRDVAVNLRDRAGEPVGLPEMRYCRHDFPTERALSRRMHAGATWASSLLGLTPAA
jgi:hypothetical protein